MKKPVIGILTQSLKKEGQSLWTINDEYRIAILKAGGIPLLITPTNFLDYASSPTKEESRFTEKEQQDYFQVLSLCDGFLVPGGENIYDFDRLIVKYAYENDLPYLGICLGMQMLGSIDSFLRGEIVDETVVNQTSINHYQPGVLSVHQNQIFHSKLHDILGVDKIFVNSRHHFHIKERDSFFVSCRSLDGLIEGIELPGRTFMIGVQWHPESMISDNKRMLLLFQALVESCKRG